MKFTLLMASAAVLLASPVQAQTFENTAPPQLSQAADQMIEKKVETADIKAIAFHSDSCGSCKIIAPRMEEALTVINPGRVDFVKFDFTNKSSIAQTQALASQKGIDGILQKYGARSGFVVLVDNKGKVVDKIKVDHDAGEMAGKIASAIANAS